MALIVWRKEFETGIAEVDHEHQELVDLINQLHDQLGADTTKETVSRFLGALRARGDRHA
jgi:hemerythrin